MDVIKTQQISSRPIEKVIVHPLVLLSIVDHYNRVARDTRKRVVGVLLGSTFKGTVDVSNSYAVPFEEDDKDPSIWFLDHNYHEAMFSMFRRINAKEHVVGWYSTGPKLRENDLDVHRLFNDYVPNPVLVIIDVQPVELGIPTKAYCAVEEVKENATQKSQKVFVHVLSEIAAHEVEEIGVEHLLRDVKDTTISTLATEVSGKLVRTPRHSWLFRLLIHSAMDKTQTNGSEIVADIFESSLTLETSHYDEGYADGYRDGAVSGKRDGYEVGLKHGFELGEELGFYKGLVDVWLSAIRVDPACFPTRVQKSIHQMSELVESYPVQDPESDSIDEMKASLRLKFRAVCASLGVKLEYDGYPKTSQDVDLGF